MSLVFTQHSNITVPMSLASHNIVVKIIYVTRTMQHRNTPANVTRVTQHSSIKFAIRLNVNSPIHFNYVTRRNTT